MKIEDIAPYLSGADVGTLLLFGETPLFAA
jgi:hypothetical protein